MSTRTTSPTNLRPAEAAAGAGGAGGAADGRLSFAAMVEHLGAILGTDLSGATPASNLRDDLGWDSLTMVEVLGLLDRYGVTLPEELLGELHTLGDVHHHVAFHAAGRSPDTAALPAVADPFLGPNVRLLPITAPDQDYLYRLMGTGRHLVSYRMRGATPGPERFSHFLWDQVLAQFLVTTHEGRMLGLVSSFEPDFRNRYAYLAAVADPAFEQSGLVLEGLALLVSYLFAEFDLRKLYAESLESNFAQFASGADRVFDVEGRLREHEYIHGAYQDYVIAAVWRDRWRAHHQRILGTEPPF